MSAEADLTVLLAEALRLHATPLPNDGYPADEYDCCAAHLASKLSEAYTLTPKGESPMPARIQEDSDGTLDDFYIENATIHFEAMSTASWWIGVTASDGRKWHINCGAHNDRAKTYAYVEEDDPRRALADALVDHLLGRVPRETP